MSRRAKWLLAVAVAVALWVGLAGGVRPARKPAPKYPPAIDALPCSWEGADLESQAWLEAQWAQARQMARAAGYGADSSTPRPRVCLGLYALVVCGEGGCERFVGLYNPERNTILLLITPVEAADAEFVECILRHEFGHALLGVGHEKVDRAYPRCG